MYLEEVPINQKQRIAVLQGTKQLQERWNSGDGRILYEQASPAFRSQPLPDWLVQREQLKEKLGVWQSFTPQRALTCGKSGNPTQSIVCLDGVTLFGKDRLEMEIGWMVQDDFPQLMFLSFGPNGKGLSLIPPPPQHLLDSPPVPMRTAERTPLHPVISGLISGRVLRPLTHSSFCRLRRDRS